MKNQQNYVRKNSWWISICLILFLSCMIGQTAEAAAKYGINNSGKGNWAYHVLSEKNKTVEIRPIDFCVVKGKVTIPNTITGQDGKTKYKVTKVADDAFCCCMCESCVDYKSVEKRWKISIEEEGECEINITKITIPANVTEIGAYAFSGNLKTVVFKGDNVTTIGEEAFSGTDITSISIPSKCKTIGDSAFEGCDKLKTVTFKGDNVTAIGYAAFYYSGITNIQIPSKIKKIDVQTFSDCASLKTVTFKGDNVTTIEYAAFSNSGITSIQIPSKIKKIDEEAFSGCASLNTITFSGTEAPTIGEDAFFNVYPSTINIENYTVYQSLLNKFEKPSDITVDSKMTRLTIEHNGNSVWVDVKKGEAIDLSSYITVPEGKELYANTIYYSDRLDGECNKWEYYYRSSEVSEMHVYKGKGYPIANISTRMEDMHYHFIGEYISSLNRHDNCDIEVLTDSQIYEGWNFYTFCYNDTIMLSDFSGGQVEPKNGYTPTGYMINEKEYLPGTKISGKTLAVTGCSYYYIDIAYQPNTYQIAYNFNGGEGSALRNTSCTYDQEATLATNTSFNGGYKFVGWCESPDGEGTIYKNGATVKNLTSTDGEVVTLYAIWKDESLVVTFNPNGGTVSQTSKKVRYNQQFGNLPTPKREGYTFKGWTLGPNGGTAVTGASIVQYNCDFNLFAQWEAKKYKITFNANGGTGGGSKEVKYGKSIGSLPKAKKKGYKFKGWYTAKSGGSKISSTTKVTARKTYYAQWEEKAKTLTITVKPKNIKKLDGYQVKYGKKGGKMTTKTYASETKKSITVKITGVKSGETYVAKARSYRKVKGKKKWSKWKTVTKTVE